MPCYIAITDITYENSTTGTHVVVTTDVPCHLFMRLSKNPPRIHKMPVLRRGIFLHDDLYFCFTAYEDNEEFSAGDHLVHHFWKTNWPVCTTKYFYFYGSVAGETCVSTSPWFEYHNTGIAPVPPPDTMYQLNPLDPEKHNLSANNAWNTLSLLYDTPADATGALLEIENYGVGSDPFTAFRKPGCLYEAKGLLNRTSLHWLIVGLDVNRAIQYFLQTGGQVRIRVMGYTGRDVVFPDTPINIKPTVPLVYQDKDILSSWPNAKLILTDKCEMVSSGNNYSIRPKGSTKDIKKLGDHAWPFCVITAGQPIQTYCATIAESNFQWQAYAYFKTPITTSVNGVPITPVAAGSWQAKTLSGLGTERRFAFIEGTGPHPGQKFGIRKFGSDKDVKQSPIYHIWAITHMDKDSKIEIYTDLASPGLVELAVTP